MGNNGKTKKRKTKEEPEHFLVECVLEARVTTFEPRGKKRKPFQGWEYHVKWAGYDSDADTWEPEENLEQCHQLLQSFWAHVGMDDKDYPEGYISKPDQHWIEAEKRRFWQTIEPKERTELQEAEVLRRKKTLERKAKQAKAKENTSKEFTPAASSSRSSSLAVKLNRSKKTIKKPRLFISDSEPDSDDVPLSHGESKEKGKSKMKAESPENIPLGETQPPEKLKIVIPGKRKRDEKSSSDEDDVPLTHQRHRPKTLKIDTSLQESDLPDEIELSKTGQDAVPGSPSSLFSKESTAEPELAPASASVAISIPANAKAIPSQLKRVDTLPTSTVNPPSAKSSPAVTPKIPQLLSDPQAKLIENPQAIYATASGISTKQRLTQVALTPINPREASKTSKSSNRSAAAVTNLRFKKTGQGATSVPTPNSATSPFQPSTTFVPDGSTTAEWPTMVKSPQLTLNDLNSTSDKPFSMEWENIQALPISSSAVKDNILPNVLPMEHPADAFLSSLKFDNRFEGLITPLEPAPEAPFEPVPPPSLIRKPSVLSGKIPKKWKWEGKLYIQRSSEQEELVGNVICTNSTNYKSPGMRLNLVFEPWDRLDFLSFHDASDMWIYLDACKTPDQYAILSTNESAESGSESFKTLVAYMTKHLKVVLVPVLYEGNLVGHLLVFPPNLNDLVKRLDVPSEITDHASNGLIVVLHGWVLNPNTYKTESRKPLADIIPGNPSLGPAFENSKPGPQLTSTTSLRASPTLHLAIRALKFPGDLYEWLISTRRMYSIYHEVERAPDRSEPIEMEMLRTILDICQAQEYKPSTHDSRKELRLRIIFVHIGSIRNFHRSPLNMRRIQLDIRYYTYGTDVNVPANMWGIREIYPIGGVVTFAPSAFIETFASTMRLIRRLHEHPFWIAYITPSVLGFLAHQACGDQDPVQAYEEQGSKFVLHNLLRTIAEGEVALVDIPPEPYSMKTETFKLWAREHCRALSPRVALSMGVGTFRSLRANMSSPSEWLKAVQAKVTRDIVAVQKLPVIMYDYRRFVIVKGSQDSFPVPPAAEGVIPVKFDFKDDFFKGKV